MIFDISYSRKFRSNMDIISVLSNLHEKPFIMDVVVYRSIEGFLQGLKFSDKESVSKVNMMSGVEAKLFGANKTIVDQTLYYKGMPFNRHSEYYQELLNNVYNKCYAQCDYFKKCLDASKGHELIHTVGKDDPFDTILTTQEFITRLVHLRDVGFLKAN